MRVESGNNPKRRGEADHAEHLGPGRQEPEHHVGALPARVAQSGRHLVGRDGGLGHASLQEVPGEAGFGKNQEIPPFGLRKPSVPNLVEVTGHVRLPGLDLHKSHPQGRPLFVRQVWHEVLGRWRRRSPSA